MKNFRSIKPNVMGGQKANPTTNSNSNWINESLSKPGTVNHDKRLFEANDLTSDSSMGTQSGGLIGAEWTSSLTAVTTTQTRTGDADWNTVRAAAASTAQSATVANIDSMHANAPHTLARLGLSFDMYAAGIRADLHEITSAKIIFSPSTSQEVFGWTKQAAGATAYASSGCYVVNGFVDNTAMTSSAKYNDPYAHSPSMEEAVSGKVMLPGATAISYWGMNANDPANLTYEMQLNTAGLANLISTGYDSSGYTVQFWVVTPQDKTDSRLDWDRHYSTFGDVSASGGTVTLDISYKVKNSPFEPLSR